MASCVFYMAFVPIFAKKLEGGEDARGGELGSLADSVDQVKRFKSAGWAAELIDGQDQKAIAAAITTASLRLPNHKPAATPTTTAVPAASVIMEALTGIVLADAPIRPPDYEWHSSAPIRRRKRATRA